MKALRSFRYVILLPFLAALFSAAFVAGLPVNAAAIATHGSTGQALALRASLRALVPASTHARTFRDFGVPQDTRRASDGRFIYSRPGLMHAGAIFQPRAAANTPQVDEAVQTYDVFNPPPGFSPTQGPSLTPTNLTPVWTADETMLIFSSNRTATGTAGTRFHIWAIPVNGGTPVQLTSSSGATGGGEFFPALSSDNNRQLAFTSDGQTPGAQNLYSIPFAAQTVAVSGLTSPTIRPNDPQVAAQGGLGFQTIQRPAFVPGNSDEIIFSALSNAGTYSGKFHLYYLYVSTKGFDPTNVSLPAKITDGPADDIDPAFSQDGQLIAFASTAGSLVPPTSLAPVADTPGPSSNPNATLVGTANPGTNHSIFLIGGGGRFGFGTLTNPDKNGNGQAVTRAGTDNTGPAWSSLRRNPYTDPAPGFEYLAFARGSAPGLPHDIYYLQVLANTDAGGETGRSNEAATTPEPARTPIYQINAGDTNGLDVRGMFGNYVPDTYVNQGRGAPQGFAVTGGTAETITPAPVVNTTNDPNTLPDPTPPQIYLTDRNGTFTYTFRNLTPQAKYRVRLHLSDPKNTAPGQRIFNVSLNGNIAAPIGQSSADIDIVGQAQSAPGRIIGLVSDASSGAAITGATITVTDSAGSPIKTIPSPLTTTTPTTDPTNPANAQINFNGSVPQGLYTITVTPPAGSGYTPVSQVVNVSSGSFTRADFPLAQGTAYISGTVSDSNKVAQPNLPVTVSDANTGLTIATTTTGNNGTFIVKVPPTPANDQYDVTVTPPVSSGLTVQTQQITVTAQNTQASPGLLTYTLASGAVVGTVGGLVTDSVTTRSLLGTTITVKGANNTTVAILKSGTTSSPAAPNGDGKPVNYLGNLPVSATPYTLVFSAPGYTSQTKQVTVVNVPGPPSNAFVRADAALVNPAPTVGKNTAIVVEFPSVTATNRSPFTTGTTSGQITVAFTPVSGDPPIVEGIEVLSDPTPEVSSGFGDLTGANFFGAVTAAAPPQIISAFGGVETDPTTGGTQSQVTITFVNTGTSTPTGYNLYRSLAAPTSTNNPPLSNAGTEGSTPYITNVPIVPLTDAQGNPITDQRGRPEFQIIDTTAAPGSEYYYQLTAVFAQILTPEAPVTTTSAGNLVVRLNTDDASGEATVRGTAEQPNTGNNFDDIYPTWSPFLSVFSIAYSSNRSITYNDPISGAATETAVSVAPGGKITATGTVGQMYAGILVSQVVNLDPPTLLPYSGNEIVHVADAAGNTTRYGITPGQKVTFVARLSSREAGIDNNGNANFGTTGSQVYLQIKNPNSKYQDAQGLEHKVFAKDQQYQFQRNNPNFNNFYLRDSGSSSQLFNGGNFGNRFGSYEGFNRIANSDGQIVTYFNRGAVGGTEDAPGSPVPGPATNGSDTITVGRDGGGTNTDSVFTTDGKPVTDPDTKQIVANPPGSDPNLFIPWGPEYECQVVNPQFATDPADAQRTAGATGRIDFRDPYYLAGVDDQQPFSGGPFSVRPTANITDGNGGLAAPAEWLQMTRLPDAQQDGQGGALYSVTWTTPTSGSDYYMDVIAFDKAVAPSAFVANNANSNGSNWRIYDNIWGFSTAASIGNNDILVVSDYALGQKFAATTFGGQRGLLNLVPKLFGAESYVTDIDVNLLPNAVYRHTVITGATPNLPSTEVQLLGSEFSPTGRDLSTFSPQGELTNPVFNGLGVGSYYDRFIDDGGRQDNVPSVRSQQYSLWRTLSRGPVPDSVYQAYLPTFQNQPVVSDTSSPTKVSVVAGRVAVANRCILWISPFTGDVLAGPGTLADTATQFALRNFVKAGGRLCISGEDVGSSLTQNGQTNNAAGGFLSDVLNATLVTSNGGTHLPMGGTSTADNRISNTPYYDGEVLGNYPELNPGLTVSTVAPGQRLIRISNNYGGNIFSVNFISFNQYAGNWRTDGSLDQLGPYIQPFPVNLTNSNAVVSAIDTIKPNATAHTDLTLAPFTNPIPPIDNGNDAAASGPGGIGLIYTESPLTAAGGSGAKVVYATFGLEALSTEYYKVTSVFKPNPVIYNPRNQRQSILHNVVNYLRTGSIAGTIRSTSGNGVVGSGVSGVTVYLQSAFGPAIPGRGTFSATTDSAGNFRIDGIEPGNYTLAAYRTGFLRATSNPGVVFTVEGDTLQQASLTLVQAAAGSITGNVKDTSGAIVPGADVIFTSSDGQTYKTQTNALGNYTLASVPPATYTGTANKAGFGASTPTPVTVASNTPLTVNFVLQPGPGTATGRVVDTNGDPIAGATVFFSSGNPVTVVATLTTDATGTYTTTSIAAGTYNVTATASGFGNSAPVQVVITGGTQTTVPDIQLGASANGTVGGLVSGTSSTTPIAGVTLTIVNTGTGQTISPSPVTSATAQTASDGGQINYGPITLPQGTYTVTASKNGVTAGSQTVTVAAATFSRADFTGISGLPALHTFSAGLNFLSLPFDYSGSTFDTLFGPLNTAAAGATPNGNRSHLAVWNPLTSVYALDPTPPADALRLGVGYWVFLKNSVALTQTGGTPTGNVSVALHPAWNQIGVPSTSPIPVSSLTFDTGGSLLTFAAAVGSQNHVVSPTLFRYDGATYQAVAATDSLQPYQAYWIKVFVNTTVHIPTGK